MGTVLVHERLLTTTEVADALGVTTQRVNQLIAAGAVERYVTAVGSLIPPEELERLVQLRRAQARDDWRVTPPPGSPRLPWELGG